MLRINLFKSVSVRQARRFVMLVLSVALTLIYGVSLAAVSQTPLFLAQPPKPNIMFTLDNSGSMVWETVTGVDAKGEYNSSKTNRAFYSSAYNQIYYNPAITYSPGVSYLGVTMGNSPTAAARIDPYPTSGGSSSKVDLSKICYVQTATPVAVTLPLYDKSNFSAGANYASCYDAVTTTGSGSSKKTYDKAIARYAFYYIWDNSTNLNIPANGGYPDDTKPADSGFPTRVDILSGGTYGKAATRTDCSADATCTYEEELQNFANWFTYHRTRILMMKTAMGSAFAPIDPIASPVNPPKYRVGFNTINVSGSNNTSVTDGVGWLTIRDFDSTQKKSFYDKLYAINPSGGTPLLEQMDRIGQLYQKTLSKFDYTGNDPYYANVSATPADKSMVSCRPSYHIMSTDGFWNGPVTPASGSSLAAIAKYYYDNDLRTTLANNVKPTNTRDTATWQHMTTFTIGLGADGTLPYTPDATPADSAWPVAKADTPSAIDDLWHAAVVGKGRYFSAKDPNQLQAGLTQVLKDISIQTGAASTGAITGSAIDGDGYFYVPSFESGKWTGHLKAYNLDSTGSVGTVQWDAATQIPAWASRKIATWNPDTKAAVNFEWANLSSGQQTALTSSDVADYLRGNKAKEQTSTGAGPGIYRYRENNLGDIVNSAPLYVKKSDFGYQALDASAGGGTIYAKFVTDKAARTPMLYVGANDGMLHAFNASTGVETAAYIPNAVFSGLISLSDPNYGHQYYVDGLLTEGDAYLSSAWKNILLGSVGAGGSGIFALDITDPSNFGATNVMWEKGIADLPDMGRVLGQITPVRLRDGTWAAIFGNGYDSISGKAVLYVIDLSTGALIKSFELTTGSVNGLSTPALLFNDKRELIGAYAGDLQGNLWKFKFQDDTSSTTLTDTSISSWSSSKLFTAVKTTGVPQPMVKRPAIAPHPNGGYMVTVATGKFIESSDKPNVDVQSIYGIWDKPGAAAVTGRTQLVAQTFATDTSTGGRTLSLNSVDWNTKRGWYIDLSLSSGERVIGDLTILDNVVMIATTLAPTTDICQGGGVSQLMAINYLSGGAPPNAMFTLAGTSFTGLSSVAIAGTVANPAWVSVGRGKRMGLSNPLDGSKPQEIGFQSGVAPYRAWHQLLVSN